MASSSAVLIAKVRSTEVLGSRDSQGEVSQGFEVENSGRGRSGRGTFGSLRWHEEREVGLQFDVRRGSPREW